jgi:hypothetical protein
MFNIPQVNQENALKLARSLVHFTTADFEVRNAPDFAVVGPRNADHIYGAPLRVVVEGLPAEFVINYRECWIALIALVLVGSTKRQARWALSYVSWGDGLMMADKILEQALYHLNKVTHE